MCISFCEIYDRVEIRYYGESFCLLGFNGRYFYGLIFHVTKDFKSYLQ